MSSQNLAAKSDAAATQAVTAGAKKDLYEIGEIPPLGHVPKNMYAWTIRKEREGLPETAMQVEVVPTWELDSHDVLVLVMAAGVNYNGVWASLAHRCQCSTSTRTPITSRVPTRQASFGLLARR